MAQRDQRSRPAVWEKWGLGLEQANGLLPGTGALLQLEAASPGPERFLITAQEPNYLHEQGTGDSGLPRALTQASAPPAPSAQAVVFASSFAYIYIWPLSTNL